MKKFTSAILLKIKVKRGERERKGDNGVHACHSFASRRP